MAADSFHHLIESEMQSRKFLYDFQDFVSVIEKKGNEICIEVKDFTDYLSKKSDGKFTNHPLLDDVKVVQFRKNSTKMFWKSDIGEEFKSGEFLQKKIIASISVHGKDTFPHHKNQTKA